MQVQAFGHGMPLAWKPTRAAASGLEKAPDEVTLSGGGGVAAPEKPLPEVKRSGLYCAACACVSFCLGPVAAGVGWVMRNRGMVLQDSQGLVPPENQLHGLPSSTLERPVLFVHGWHSETEFYRDLTDKLTEGGRNGGRTGYVQNGQLFADEQCKVPLDKPTPDMKVFLSVFTSNRMSPTASAPELKANVDAIRKLTGCDKLDFASYSLGGIATRQYAADHPEHHIGKFLMLGTPNQGAGLAGLVARGLEKEREGWDVSWLLRWQNMEQADTDAVDWLRPTSPQREALNARWPAQQETFEAVLHLGSRSALTPSKLLVPVWGDGTVTANSLKLPGLPVEHLSVGGTYGHHANLLANPEGYTRMREFFGWS